MNIILQLSLVTTVAAIQYVTQPHFNSRGGAGSDAILAACVMHVDTFLSSKLQYEQPFKLIQSLSVCICDTLGYLIKILQFLQNQLNSFNSMNF